jgi:RHS repeat-associated protein
MSMTRRIGVGLGLAFTMSGAMFVWPAVSARQQSTSTGTTAAAFARGQSATQLPDGRWLLLGGEGSTGTLAAGEFVDAATGVAAPLAGALTIPRADHTATVLPDGSVLIVGGHNETGSVATAELFDPPTQTFTTWPIAGSVPRAGHTTTVLSDGRLLVAGGVNDAMPAPMEMWSVETHTAQAVPVTIDRAGHTATLLDDGRVSLAGGRSADGRAVAAPTIVDPATITVTSEAPVAVDGEAPRVVFSAPAAGETNVPLSTRVVVRFSAALRIETIGDQTLRLTGPQGGVATRVVGAEGGRLAFVWPLDALTEGTTYTLTIDGATNARGMALAPTIVTFTTVEPTRAGGVPDEEAWLPSDGGKAGWRSGRTPSPWESLAPLVAPPGVTAVSGRVLRLDGRPLADVTLEIEERTTRTDRTGRFLLLVDGMATGEHTLEIDARTANKPGRTYGFYEARIGAHAGRTTVLPFTIWSPLIDIAHQVTIPSPTTTETVVTTPTMPGLELHLPAGTVITDEDGAAVTTVSLTPIPLDRTPFPLPEDATFTMFFTIQPGGAYLSTPGPIKGGWLVYPRNGESSVGKRVRFFNYDPDDRGWFAYGLGTVTPTKVVPDTTTRVYGFTGASFNDGNEPPPAGPPPGDCPTSCGGDPVNLTTGIFTYEMTDLVVPDVMPLVLTRTYNSQDTATNNLRPFGVGMTHPYAVFLHMLDVSAFAAADLILPDGGRLPYLKTAESGPNWWQTIFEHTAAPTGFYKSRLAFWGGILANGGWQITRKDGTVYVFGHAAPLQAIRDRNGNEIRLTWSTTNSFGSGTGNIVRVTSPHGRWIEFSYYTGTSRVYQAKDTIGRTVTYAYDGNGRLSTVTDPENHVTSYTWDANDRMQTVKPPNLQGTQTNLVTNEYTTATDAPTPVGWVKKQTMADGGVYQFGYTVANGKSTSTDVTDPRGVIRRVTFNPDGYTVNDTRALGAPEEQAASWVRQASGNFVTSSTDALNRPMTTTYDDNGNVTSVTRLTGSDAVTTTYTYAAFNQVATITDPLTHTTTFGYDAKGNRTSVTDALNHTTTAGYNAAGQLTSVTDALQHTTGFEYTGSDLIKVTDPLGRLTQWFSDAGGRVLTQTDPLGRTMRFEYDNLNRRTRIVDALGGTTASAYDAGGRLTSVTDARNNTTTYTSDALDRLAGHTDPLLKTETFAYDANGNLTLRTDRKGQVTARTYDPLNRLKQVTYADSSTITNTYDAGNRLSTVADSVTGTITRTYDNLDRLTSETTLQGTVSYTYDVISRRATMTVLGQPTVSYGYDDADRLTTITQGTTAAAFAYDNANRQTGVTLPNGVNVDHEYDDASQLTALTYRLGTTTLGTLTYVYDLSGQRIQVGGTWARTGLPPALASATHDAANRVSQWAGQTFSYDANGNMGSDGPTAYTFNARDQFIAATGATPTASTYDAISRRTSRTVAGTTTSLLYDGLNTVQELSGGTPIANLLAGLALDEPLQRVDATGAHILLRDGLASSLALADAAGTVQTHYTYEPFGRTAATGSPSTNAAQFAGRENDETGLYNYRARYYRPDTQSFISEDPLGLTAGVNVYAYVDNSPISKIDPLGLDTYMCKHPLQLLGGSGVRSGPDLPGNPLYHQFLCVSDGKGGYICGGQDRSSGGFPGSRGKPSDDKWPPNPEQACKAQDDRKCVDDCVLRRIRDPKRPWFSIGPLGTDCQEWSYDVLRDCQKECKGGK